jgi:exopolysaccharide biosynthesis protein
MDFDHARAARIALGADASGKPMLLWAEGAAKFGYVPGKGSCGASLKEMADICADLGMHNAVNLDGGGSAQILLNNRRSLMISDRKAEDHSEAERPVPLALYIPAE